MNTHRTPGVGLLRLSVLLSTLLVATAIPMAVTAAGEVASIEEVTASLARPHSIAATWDAADETAISLDDLEGTVTIDEPGAYRLSGTLSDGQLVVDADDDGAVWLILDDVSITSSTTAAISILDADDAVVWLEESTQNTLVDASEYQYASAEENEPNATLFSKDDLTIAGTGELTVDANYNDGITSKDGLVIADGTITVTAADDGLRGKDYLVISGGTLDVTASGDALKSDNEEDDTLGYVVIADGTIDVTAGADAIEAVSAVLISGGNLTLSADDDGIHSEAWLEISDGTIDITESYEGLEGTQIVISGGATSVVAEDDGLNVSDGNGSLVPTGGAGGARRGGGPPIEEPIEGLFADVSGGTLVIDADGDGFESNGVAAMSGGTVVISGPTTSREGAIDVNGEFLVSGGTLLAAGSVGMVETPTASSEQAVLNLQFDSVVPAGTVVRIVADDGTDVATYEAQKAIQSIVLSTPDLVAGETYEVLLEGQVSGESLGGLYLEADYSGGTSAGTLAAV